MAKLLSGTRVYGTATVDSQLIVAGTATSTSTLTGALLVTGGVGIRGDLWVGGTINGTIAGAGTAGTANTSTFILTSATNSTASHFVTFVDANNSTATAESVLTTSSIRVVPSTGKIDILSTLSSTSTLTGALVVTGGVGIGGNLYVGGTINGASSGVVSGTISTASSVVTTATNSTSSHFVAFVDSNNTASAAESVYTTSSIRVNPNSGGLESSAVKFFAQNTTTFVSVEYQTISNRGSLGFFGLNNNRLLTLVDTNTGTVFAAAGESGIPSIEVLDTGRVKLAEYGNFVEILSTTASNSTSTGALTVAGGVGIGGNLWVGGTINGTISGAGTANSLVSVATNSTSLHFLTFVDANNTTATAEAFYTTSSIRVVPSTGEIDILSTLSSTSTLTGALVVTGGVGIGGNLYVGGVINGTITGAGTVATTATNSTSSHFLTFVDSNNTSTTSESVYTTSSIRVNPNSGGLESSAVKFFSQNTTTFVSAEYQTILNKASLGFFGPNNNRLLSIVDITSGTIFAIAGESGVPNIEVLDTGRVKLAEFGNFVEVLSTTASNSTSTGALTVAGGVGIAGNLYVGGIINGTFAGSVSTASNVTLSGITAATANNTNNNGNNAQRWNWALTTANTSGFYISESAASTNGTGTQYLFDVQTVASSTANPFRVGARGSANTFIVSNTGSVSINSPGNGGAINLNAGSGNINLTGGNGSGGTVAGSINITGGNGDYLQAGNISLIGGYGNYSAFGGNPAGTAGNVVIQGGNSDYATPGSVYITGGTNLSSGSPGYNGGDIYLTGGTRANPTGSRIGQVFVTNTNIIVGTTSSFRLGTTNTSISGTGNIIIAGTASSTGTNTGALTVAGGAGIGGDLYVGGTIYQGGVAVGTGGSATTASSIQTVLTTTNANHFITFVDANNATATGEALYTTSSLVTNPRTGEVDVLSTLTASSTTTGALVVTGGVGVGGQLWANQLRQTSDKVAIGGAAGVTNQGTNSTAIGISAGNSSQGVGAVALGTQAGETGQGNYAIAIGFKAGITNQPANSIVLNSNSAELNIANSGFYVNPVRADATTSATSHIVYYNPATRELTTATATSLAATSADKWTTARTLTLAGDLSGSASFDGSANFTLTATIAADSVALGTDTTGNYVASIANGNYITGGGAGSEGAALTLAVDATSTNTVSKVVARDGSGNFSAGTITASLTGTASNATNLAGGAAGSVPYQSGAGATTFVSIATTSGWVLSSNGSVPIWQPSGAISVSNDTTTNANYYPVWVTNTSGSPTGLSVSDSKLYFNPSSGTLNATVFNSLSDVALKKDIDTITNPLEILNQLNGVSFKWKENDNKSYGVIAQELEKILPDLVSGKEQKSVNYLGIIPFLINAIKELNQKIIKLENNK